MLRYTVVLFSCVLVLGFSTASGHAPDKLDLNYDLESRTLEVSISHQVKDAAKHHVDRVLVELNGNKVIEQSLVAQESLERQTVIYRITDASVGDTLTVTAECNISGRKTAMLKIEPPKKVEAKKGEADKAEPADN